MGQYIPKDDLIAWAKETYLCENASAIRKVYYKQLVEHLNVLEVKEVDFEEVFNDEYSKFSNDTDAGDYAFPIDLADFKDFAKHFFVFGIKVQKGEKLC